MKKIYTLCLSAFLGASAFAQTQPERILVHQVGGAVNGYLAERVDSITFPKLEGRVAADLSILEVKKDTLVVTIQRTENCVGFKLMSVPQVIANRLVDEAAMANYVDKAVPDQNIFQQDFEKGILSDPSWESDVKYELVAVGYDRYAIPCSVSRKPFATPRNPLVGDPKVKVNVDDITARSFACTFTPNQDVAGYAAVAAEEGTIQQQYEMFAPMMGFKNFGQMIQAWGTLGEKDEVGFEWKQMEPNTVHDLFVQAWDVNGTYADCDTLKIKTKMLGGEGVASVTVKLGDYVMSDWYGEMKPSQFISFTPNDQSSCYRYIVDLAENYDKDPEGYKGQVAMDPPFPMANWFFYEPMETDFQINPNTDFVVLCAAKNGLGKWGEVKVERFKTAEKVAGAEDLPATKQVKVGMRKVKNNTLYVQPGKMPEFYKSLKPAKMTLK